MTETAPETAGPAAAVIVTTATGGEIRFAADEFDAEDQLDIRDASRKGNSGIVASYASGHWRSVRLDGATAPDATRRQLGIAKAALEGIARGGAGKWREVAETALERIYLEGE